MTCARAATIIFILIALPCASAAQTASVRQVFERHGLIGTFARDCSEVASQKTPYRVRRVIDDNNVQHDLMHGPTNRVAWSIIDSAELRGQNEVAYSQWNAAKTERTNSVIRVEEKKRWRVLEMTENARRVVVGGRFTFGDRLELPWNKKCE